MTKTGSTRTTAVGNPKFKNTKTFEEVRGRKRIHWVEKGTNKTQDPLRRYYRGWKCRDCGKQNSIHDVKCSCGKARRN